MTIKCMDEEALAPFSIVQGGFSRSGITSGAEAVAFVLADLTFAVTMALGGGTRLHPNDHVDDP